MKPWSVLAVLCLLSTTPTAFADAYVPLATACEILDRIDARGLAGIGPEAGENTEMPLKEYGTVRLSSCNLPSKGMFGYGLLLREETSPKVRPAPEQMEDLLRQYAEAWGEDPNAEPVDLEVPAVWIPSFHQLWIIAREGHANLIVSMPEDADAAAAAAFAGPILDALD